MAKFHWLTDAQAYVTKHDLKSQVAADIRAIFTVSSLDEAQRLLDAAVEKYSKSQSKLAAWMEENIPEGLDVLTLPAPMRRRLRTSNMAENITRQIRHRTRVAGLFPSESSLLRLVSAVLSESSEEVGDQKDIPQHRGYVGMTRFQISVAHSHTCPFVSSDLWHLVDQISDEFSRIVRFFFHSRCGPSVGIN